MSTVTKIDELGHLGQKQRVQLTTDDGTTVETRVSQAIYDPDEKLRLEMSSGKEGEYQRYQVQAEADDGDWTDPTLRGYGDGSGEWVELGTVSEVTPVDESRSADEGDAEPAADSGAEQ